MNFSVKNRILKRFFALEAVRKMLISSNSFLIPHRNDFHLTVELLLRGVEPVLAGGTAHRQFGLHAVAAAHALGQHAVIVVGVVVEFGAAMFAADFVKDSHSCSVLRFYICFTVQRSQGKVPIFDTAIFFAKKMWTGERPRGKGRGPIPPRRALSRQ